MSTAQDVARGLGLGALVTLAVAVSLVALLWVVQRQLIYFPDRTPVPPAGEVIEGARDVTLRTADGLALGAWFVPAAQQVDTGMAVLLAPGNAGNRAGRGPLAEHLRDRGLAVLLMDYRGYGGNPGSPSEDGLAADADAAVQALAGLGYPPRRTLFVGESLGTGVVASLQARHRPAGLVLRSPFTELADVAAHHYPWLGLGVRRLLRDEFEVLDRLAVSEVPVTVVYGENDSVVPSELSARVADAAPSLAERVVLAGADHNDAVMVGPPVADAVAGLAQQVG